MYLYLIYSSILSILYLTPFSLFFARFHCHLIIVMIFQTNIVFLMFVPPKMEPSLSAQGTLLFSFYYILFNSLSLFPLFAIFLLSCKKSISINNAATLIYFIGIQDWTNLSERNLVLMVPSSTLPLFIIYLKNSSFVSFLKLNKNTQKRMQ